MDITGKMLKWIIPSPKTCFLWSMLLLLVSAGLATDSMVFRKRLDEHGQIIIAPNGADPKVRPRSG